MLPMTFLQEFLAGVISCKSSYKVNSITHMKVYSNLTFFLYKKLLMAFLSINKNSTYYLKLG